MKPVLYILFITVLPLAGLPDNEIIEVFADVSYPTLPSGDYELQLQALNKFDVPARLLFAPFTIEKLLWEKIWFQLLTVVSFLALIGVLVWVIAVCNGCRCGRCQ